MNPKDARAFLSAKAGEGNSWPKPLGSGGRLREPAKERFSRDAYQHRRTYLDKSIQRSEQSRVVFCRFSKTNPRINRHPFRGHSVAYRDRNALSKEFSHLAGDILVVGLFLHRSGISLHMHENDSSAGFRGHLGHERITAERSDIIDDFRAQIDGCLGDDGFGGVDGDDHFAALPQTLDHGDDPPKFFFRLHGLGSRPCRLSTDVDDLSSF